jgi:fructan beta-fructosidase
VWLAASVLLTASTSAAVRAQRAEPFRPQYHFTPDRNWMNDPNGMVFYDGEWHLFYQYNPFGEKWGHMSWGHAVSRDLVRWETLPLALAESDGIMIFSGSAVIDWQNTSGFGVGGKPPMVAIYTGHREGRQDQRIAYSNDKGRTWTKFAGNPVLDLQKADFRDPKVFWHAASSRWIMTVALSTEKKVRFYASTNLKAWTMVGEFGPAGATDGLWECPDLFELPVEGGGTKWVLIVNINPGGPAGGSGSQYFTGAFDGRTFTVDTDAKGTRWADYGADFYAGVSWGDVPKVDGRRVWLGWMSNWQYAQDVPTRPWRSEMSVPRSLSLRKTPDGLRLVQTPVRELTTMRKAPARAFSGGTLIAANAWLAAQKGLPPLLDVELALNVTAATAPLTLTLTTAPGEQTDITIDPAAQQLAFDRTRSGKSEFFKGFAAKHAAPLRIGRDGVRVRLLLDASSLEVFAQDGETVLTELIFPSGASRTLSITGATAASAQVIKSISIHPLMAPRAMAVKPAP